MTTPSSDPTQDQKRSGETAVPAQAEQRSEECAMGDDGLTEHCGCCGHRRAPGQSGGPLCACTLDGLEFMTREAMAMVVPTLVEEYRRAEGDLGVAVQVAAERADEIEQLKAQQRADHEDAAERFAAADIDLAEQDVELELLRKQQRAALDLCDRSEALHRKIWDEMTDYADIGHPKGEYPGAPWFERQVRAALGAGKGGNDR